MPDELQAETGTNEVSFQIAEGVAAQDAEGRHHAPDLSGVVPGEIAAGDHEQDFDVREVGLRLGDGVEAVGQQDGRQIDRGAAMAKDRFLCPVDDAIRGQEVRHVDPHCEDRRHAESEAEDGLVAEQDERRQDDDRAQSDAPEVNLGRDDGLGPGRRRCVGGVQIAAKLRRSPENFQSQKRPGFPGETHNLSGPARPLFSD